MLSPTCEPGTTIDDPTVVERLLDGGCVISQDGDRVWLGWGRSRPSDRREPGRLSVYAPDFFLRAELPWTVYEASTLVSAQRLIDALEPFAEPQPRPFWASSPFAEFESAFDDVQRRIAAGALVKAVPFVERTARIAFDRGRRADVLVHALRRSQGQALCAYGLWDERAGMVGTTPEILFRETVRRTGPHGVATMALAGTRTRDGGSLLDDPKETTEHRIVVDGIVERLAPLGRVSVGVTEELRLPTLAHLHTPIDVVPERPVLFEAWVAALHPTPAIGAWPKAEGWRWLLAQPNAERRGRYGAPFGFVPPDAQVGTCLVAIRNVQWSEGEARLLAGGGIVAASRVDREWREFNAKLDSIAEALGL